MGFSFAAAVCEAPRCSGNEPVMRVHAPAATKMTASETNDASAMRRWRIARSRATCRWTHRGSPL